MRDAVTPLLTLVAPPETVAALEAALHREPHRRGRLARAHHDGAPARRWREVRGDYGEGVGGGERGPEAAEEEIAGIHDRILARIDLPRCPAS